MSFYGYNQDLVDLQIYFLIGLYSLIYNLAENIETLFYT